MRVIWFGILLCIPCFLFASYNQWQGGAGNKTLTNNSTIIRDGSGTWRNDGAVANFLRRLEIRDSAYTQTGDKIRVEVVNQISVLGIYAGTTRNNIVEEIAVRRGGSIQCVTPICSDGNSLYIGASRTASQLITLRVDNGGIINRNGYGRINVSGYLGTILNSGQILGEGVVIGRNGFGHLGVLNNYAGGVISGVSGVAGNHLVDRIYNAGTINTIANITSTKGNVANIENAPSGVITSITGVNVFDIRQRGRLDNLTSSTIGEVRNESGTLNNVSNNTITTFTISGGNVNRITNNAINTINVSGGNVALISNPQQGLPTLNISGGVVQTLENISITNLTNSGGTITNLTTSTNVSRLNNAGGTITNLTLYQNIGYNPNTNAHINGSITNLNIEDFSITLHNNYDIWNSHTFAAQGMNDEHLYMNANVGNLIIQPGAIKVSLGANVDKKDGVYSYDKVILNAPAGSINFSHLTPTQGLELFDVPGRNGFSLGANASNSFGASALQSIQLNDTRRIVIIQNILDSINYHHFYRTAIKRQESKEQTNKDTQAQKIDTSNWQKKRTFAIPYGLYGNLSVNNTKSHTYAGGAISGVQRDFGHLGIGVVYLGYEYNSTTSQLSVADATLSANVAQGGMAHIKLLKSDENKQFYLKSNLRSTLTHLTINAKENKNLYDASTFTYHIGGAVRGGMAYYFDSMSYIAPELGVSYDLMGVAGFEIEKGVLANEVYPTHNVHLPQLSASMKYYKAIGQFYRYSILVGGRYSPNNKPTLKFQNGIFSDEARIYLPLFYANVDASFSRAISRVSELGVSYNGLAYNGGQSHSLSVKYVKWF